MRHLAIIASSLLLATAGCAALSGPATAEDNGAVSTTEHPVGGYAASATEGELAVAVFAGGCFWCVESEFDGLEGVVSAISGYTGGDEKNPSYKQVAGKKTGHVEAVRVLYKPEVVTYTTLIDLFWRNIDPFQTDGQFCDRGKPYHTAVFTADETQKRLAESTRAAVAERFGRDVVTPIRPATIFWPAEEYHQDFHLKNPRDYKSYRKGCGRDRRLEELWGPSTRSQQ